MIPWLGIDIIAVVLTCVFIIPGGVEGLIRYLYSYKDLQRLQDINLIVKDAL